VKVLLGHTFAFPVSRVANLGRSVSAFSFPERASRLFPSDTEKAAMNSRPRSRNHAVRRKPACSVSALW